MAASFAADRKKRHFPNQHNNLLHLQTFFSKFSKGENMAHYLKHLFFSVEDVFPDIPPLICPTPEAWIHPAGQRELTGIFIWMSGANR